MQGELREGGKAGFFLLAMSGPRGCTSSLPAENDKACILSQRKGAGST
ncbi:MAG: hypothetical protein GVY20_15080 [Bacteroidetes bacterium]|jgi:hypothetical protein|nr:hypothetical protein [Bacteroidota bacterium]